MGTKSWMLLIADGDVQSGLVSGAADPTRAAVTAASLFPGDKLEPLPDGRLGLTCPPRGEICVGCFPGVELIAAREFAIDHPSRLPAKFLQHAGTRTVYLHAMHSVVDWFAFAIWKEGQLIRSLSVSPDSGVMEDVGRRMEFELPYWEGKHPAVAPEDQGGVASYPLPFHPLELGDAALWHLFGYRLEGHAEESPFDPDSIPLLRFKRNRRWFPWW